MYVWRLMSDVLVLMPAPAPARLCTLTFARKKALSGLFLLLCYTLLKGAIFSTFKSGEAANVDVPSHR